MPRPRATLAGVVAAAIALATGELVCGLLDDGPSLITAVGTQFIDRFAQALKEFAVRAFGTNDKVALVVGIVAVSLVAGAFLGRLARRRFAFGVIGFAAFGLVGLACYLDDPLGSPATGVAATVAAVLAGIGALALLLRLGRLRRPRPSATGPVTITGDLEPFRGRRPTRRLFLTAVGALGITAGGATVLGRRLSRTTLVDAARQRTVLPEASPPSTAPKPKVPTSTTTSATTTTVPATTVAEAPATLGEATSTATETTVAETTTTAPETTTTVPSPAPSAVEGITPYITPNGGFFRIDTALITPQVDVSSWRLAVTGMVDQPYEISYDELVAMSTVEDVVTLQCVSNEVGGTLVGNAVWQGVPLSTILGRAGVRPGATQIIGRSVDDFTAGFPTAVGLDGRTALIAVGMNGVPLPVEHGFPARLIVAGLYGYVSATKWLRQIELTTLGGADGYWIRRGWAKEGPIKSTSRIDVPRADMFLRAGRHPIAGVAWAPVQGVGTVEVQVDDGPWTAARLGEVANGNTWVQWVLDWDATPGVHVLRVRTVGRDGTVQTEAAAPPIPDGASGWHSRRVRVS
ncbi:MAG: molybdopterin-dependent oxidoreductase [Actinomycetota bacterium]|nr:molybdopterin-dependent oxidoreductase [Actinomycetota bacterium]